MTFTKEKWIDLTHKIQACDDRNNVFFFIKNKEKLNADISCIPLKVSGITLKGDGDSLTGTS